MNVLIKPEPVSTSYLNYFPNENFTLQGSNQTVAHSHGHTVTLSYSSQVTVLFDLC
jgi:hypothetical protein